MLLWPRPERQDERPAPSVAGFFYLPNDMLAQARSRLGLLALVCVQSRRRRPSRGPRIADRELDGQGDRSSPS